MWAVLYDDGTSLTTASEPIARGLAEAERQRGHHVTIRQLDDAAAPEPELARPAERTGKPEAAPEPEPAAEPEPVPVPEPEPERTLEPELVTELEPVPEPEPARERGPGRSARPARTRRLLVYACAAVLIAVAATLADHWNALPRVGATTSSSPTQGGPSPRPQLLPPLDQPPVIHFSDTVTARGGSR